MHCAAVVLIQTSQRQCNAWSARCGEQDCFDTSWRATSGAVGYHISSTGDSPTSSNGRSASHERRSLTAGTTCRALQQQGTFDEAAAVSGLALFFAQQAPGGEFSSSATLPQQPLSDSLAAQQQRACSLAAAWVAARRQQLGAPARTGDASTGTTSTATIRRRAMGVSIGKRPRV